MYGLELLLNNALTMMNEMLYHISDIIRVGILIFGVYIGWNIRRPLVFRLKLITLFVVPMAITYLAWNGQYQFAVKDIASTMVALMLMILYWREVKDAMTSEGYYKNALSKVIEKVPDMVWMKDLDGRITYANESAANRMFYLPHHDILGKTCHDIEEIHRKNGKHFAFDEKCGSMDQYIFDTSETRMQIECGYINGKLTSLQVYNSPIYSKEKNKTIGLIGVARDITEYYIDHIKMKTFLDSEQYDELKEIINRHYEKTICEESTTCKIMKDKLHIL